MAALMCEIEGLLASRLGLDPVSVGPKQIARAVQQRMQELGLADVGEYESWVRKSESELQALIEEVVVSESWFFRDERPFQYFRDYVRERWLNDPLRPPLRVLSLACAGGEEPYSIAIGLRELGLTAQRFHIDAVDISARRLEIARRGVYSANAFRGSDLGYRARHFREHPQGYELDALIRGTVTFHQASALDLRPLKASTPYDVIFCRNLLIYLEARARLCVMASIDKRLAPDGLLFIGHADRLDVLGDEPKFVAVGHPGCFAYCHKARGDACSNSLPLKPPLAAEIIKSAGTAAGPAPVRLPPADPTAMQSFQPDATAIGSRQINVPPLLDQAAELANKGRFDEAVATCEQHLQSQGLSPSAYYLMGMICQAAGNRQRAEDCFHKTVYLDPLHDEALLTLALLAERRGDHAAAAGFHRRAERSVTSSGKRVK
ncbi:MAG TPA: CheR family methyltransferase [Isosphaeraceae bacterium]|nr:CheR family methyltransferase [Isosphaeraceae bacterium]